MHDLVPWYSGRVRSRSPTEPDTVESRSISEADRDSQLQDLYVEEAGEGEEMSDAGLTLAFSVIITAVRELTVDWFLKRQVTHVYTFDAAFSAEDTLYLADIVASADTVRFVCSCFDSCWTRWGFVVVKRLTIAMSGGEGSRTMYVLARNDQDLVNDHDQVFLICACVLSKSIIFIHIRVCVSVGCCPYS